MRPGKLFQIHPNTNTETWFFLIIVCREIKVCPSQTKHQVISALRIEVGLVSHADGVLHCSHGADNERSKETTTSSFVTVWSVSKFAGIFVENSY